MAYDIRMNTYKILIYKDKLTGRWIVSPPRCSRYMSLMTSTEHSTYEKALSDALVVRVLIAIERRNREKAKAKEYKDRSTKIAGWLKESSHG